MNFWAMDWKKGKHKLTPAVAGSNDALGKYADPSKSQISKVNLQIQPHFNEL